jgi:cation:H+ antiporter
VKGSPLPSGQGSLESERRPGYTRSDWVWMCLAGAIRLPLILVRFVRFGADSPFIVAVVTGLAIIAAAFFLSWATEALETVVAQSVALAALALAQSD